MVELVDNKLITPRFEIFFRIPYEEDSNQGLLDACTQLKDFTEDVKKGLSEENDDAEDDDEKYNLEIDISKFLDTKYATLGVCRSGYIYTVELYGQRISIILNEEEFASLTEKLQSLSQVIDQITIDNDKNIIEIGNIKCPIFSPNDCSYRELWTNVITDTDFTTKVKTLLTPLQNKNDKNDEKKSIENNQYNNGIIKIYANADSETAVDYIFNEKIKNKITFTKIEFKRILEKLYKSISTLEIDEDVPINKKTSDTKGEKGEPDEEINGKKEGEEGLKL